MTGKGDYDALVIGGGVNGLTAAAYLARGGKRTLVIEAREALGGLCQTADLGKGHLAPMVAHALYALDPTVTTELKLTRHGLGFAQRDTPLALMRSGADRLVLTRDIRASVRNIAVLSKVDADAWPRYRNELFALGRAMRAPWWHANGKLSQNETINRIARTGAGAWLDSWFESDALKALLAFDASALSPLEADSALPLVWRAAQEMCGLQAAVAFPRGGPGALVLALTRTCEAAGVEVRTSSQASEVAVQDGHVTGVRLHSDEFIAAPLVLSSASRRATLLKLAHGVGLGIAERRELENAVLPVAAAKIMLALDGLPETDGMADILGGRLILADRMESYVAAHADSRAGRISEEPVMEVTFPTVADPTLAPNGGHVASVLVRPVPHEVAGGWKTMKAEFAAKVLSRLNNCIPGLVKRAVALDVLTPDVLCSRYGAEFEVPGGAQMLADWPARVQTAIDGLFLCGADADVSPAVSGRAGRIAANLAITSGSR